MVAPLTVIIYLRVICVRQVRYQNHGSITIQNWAQIARMSLAALYTLMKLGSVFPHLQNTSSFRQLLQHLTSFQVLVQGLSPWCLGSFQCLSEWLRSSWVLTLLQLYIYIIRISPTTAFFFQHFLPYLPSSSPLGSERYDLWEDSRQKLPVQELWLSYFPTTINIKPLKLVYRTLQHALTCIVSSLEYWYRTFRPHKTIAPRGLYTPY